MNIIAMMILLLPRFVNSQSPTVQPTVQSIEITYPGEGVFPYNDEIKIQWITQGSALSTCGDVHLSLYQNNEVDDGNDYFTSIINSLPNDKTASYKWIPSETIDSNTGDEYGDLIVGSHYAIRVQCTGSVIDSDYSEYFDISLTSNPTSTPTVLPSPQPSVQPTEIPTLLPIPQPTPYPTRSPDPTLLPTQSYIPSQVPIPSPTVDPSSHPTSLPTLVPFSKPTPSPSSMPSPLPTPFPTKNPIPTPTSIPSLFPTRFPTIVPTPKPTHSPTSWIQATDHGWMVAGWVGGAVLIVLAVIGIYVARKTLIATEKSTKGLGQSYIGDEYTHFDGTEVYDDDDNIGSNNILNESNNNNDDDEDISNNQIPIANNNEASGHQSKKRYGGGEHSESLLDGGSFGNSDDLFRGSENL